MSIRTIVLLAASMAVPAVVAEELATEPKCGHCMERYLGAIDACALAAKTDPDAASCADSAGRDFADCSNAVCTEGAPVKYEGRDHWSFVVGGEERCESFSASFANPHDGRSYFAGWINGSLPNGSEEDTSSVEQVVVRMNGQEDEATTPKGAFYSGAGGWIRPLKSGVNTVTLEASCLSIGLSRPEKGTPSQAIYSAAG